MTEEWLNGNTRTADSVLIGTGVYCVGCGLFKGLACVGIIAGYVQPPVPTWPFNEADCPVHTDYTPAPSPQGEPCRVCGGSGLRPTVPLP